MTNPQQTSSQYPLFFLLSSFSFSFPARSNKCDNFRRRFSSALNIQNIQSSISAFGFLRLNDRDGVRFGQTEQSIGRSNNEHPVNRQHNTPSWLKPCLGLAYNHHHMQVVCTYHTSLSPTQPASDYLGTAVHNFRLLESLLCLALSSSGPACAHDASPHNMIHSRLISSIFPAKKCTHQAPLS